MTFSLRRVEGEVRQKLDVIGSRSWWKQVLWTSKIYFIKEIWICAMSRYYAESNINILLIRDVSIDSGVRQ